ncbi:MAG: restriction endonuclease [Ruminococcus sp.]|nr:restriction endonuclease [Ruminococcus sp.]
MNLFGRIKKYKQTIRDLEDKLEKSENAKNAKLFQQKKDISKNFGLVNDFKNLHQLTDIRFENFIRKVFKFGGYYNEGTDKYDNGSDLILSKEQNVFFIQIKGRKTKNNIIDKNDFIKEDDVYKYTNKLNDVKNKVFITNTYFTENAIKILEKNNFEIIDLEKLYILIAQVLPELIAAAYMSVDGLEKCPNCNKHMCLCHSYGDFYGCTSYPYCNYRKKKL